ncbi:MAG: hypothetical protein GY821_01495 [Gammaproteobacteria bacterium]|nr:hypothetical protein [Gammaproteobacteria bacterium]
MAYYYLPPMAIVQNLGKQNLIIAQWWDRVYDEVRFLVIRDTREDHQVFKADVDDRGMILAVARATENGCIFNSGRKVVMAHLERQAASREVMRKDLLLARETGHASPLQGRKH